MEIRRSDNSVIKKRKRNFKNIEPYNELKVKQAIKYLNNEITNGITSNFDNITYALQKKNKTTKFATYNKNTGCISSCKRLKKELSKLGLKTYFVSCKATDFSNPAGNEFVKEAHVFLVYPSLKNNKLYFTIFDPGFRVTDIISFYDGKDSIKYPYLSQGTINAKYIPNNIDYPYEIVTNKRINYKHEIIDANIHWGFNPYYETLNIDDYNEKLYHAMFSLKLMNYPKDINKYLCIRSKILEKTLEIYTINEYKVYSFKELSLLTQQELKNVFKKYFIQAEISIKELNKFSKNIFLLIHNIDTYINQIIIPSVIKEYNLGYKWNR